jgi:hypothetical protein
MTQLKTFLAQNEFISNSAADIPSAAGSAGATPCPQPRAPAAPIEVSVALPSGPVAAETAAIDSCQEPVAADLILNSGAPQPRGEPAQTDATQPAGSPTITDDIPEIFRVAHQLCAEARQFIPDYPSIYQAMLDESAPRASADDPVWTDASPLFLRSADAS